MTSGVLMFVVMRYLSKQPMGFFFNKLQCNFAVSNYPFETTVQASSFKIYICHCVLNLN